MGVIPDPPDPRPGEVLVRLHATGVCGSDMHTFSEGAVAGLHADYPSVLGHEPSGEVVEAGPGVTDLAQGARVAVEPFIVRAECERIGRDPAEVELICGGRVRGPEDLEPYAALGVSRLVISPPAQDVDGLRRGLDRFARDVIERL